MNLSRAKTILICAFLGLNLFLCYHLFGEELQNMTRRAVPASELRNVEEQLAQNGYLLETEVDRSIKKSAFLTVTPSREVAARLRKRFAAVESAADSGGFRFYEGPGAQIKVYPGGAVRVDLIPGEALLEGVASKDDQELASTVERFLQDYGLVPAPLRFDYLLRSGEKICLHYVQVFEEMPLYSGYLKAFLENNRLKAIEIYWLEPGTPLQEREMEVIPVTEALLRLVEVLGPSPQPRRIIKAELGFYSCAYDAEMWEVPPVWRFLFENKESYFINAVTGNLELETSN